VIYTTLHSASNGTTVAFAANGTQPASAAGVRSLSDQSAWMAEFRFHRNFYP